MNDVLSDEQRFAIIRNNHKIIQSFKEKYKLTQNQSIAYFWRSYYDLSFSEIGRILSSSRQYAFQSHKRACEKIRKYTCCNIDLEKF